MTTTATSRGRLPAGWARILEKAADDVQQALAAAREREQALDALPPLVPPDGPHEITLQRLRHWKERLRHLESRARQAEQQAQELSADLEGCENGIRGWLSEAEALRQRLADWEGKC